MQTKQTNDTGETREVIHRLKRDLVKAAATLSIDEARFLVDAYYQIQEHRKTAGNQVRAIAESEEPPAHSRAKRWAVKLFLAHYHHVAWSLATGTPPPKPYVISVLGHADFIAPPNFDGAAAIEEATNGRS